jgi:hypothetical protein
MFIDCGISFQTSFPALNCAGKMILLPIKDDKREDLVTWKIWVLSTWVENLVQYPEKPELLLMPGTDLNGVTTIETDVFIVGAGTS